MDMMILSDQLTLVWILSLLQVDLMTIQSEFGKLRKISTIINNKMHKNKNKKRIFINIK